MVLKVLGLIIACGFVGWCMYALAKTDDALRWGELDYTVGRLHKLTSMGGLTLAVCFIALLGC